MIAEKISLTRRNHALEHATMQILGARKPGLRMVGRSTPGGFWLIGNLDLELLQLAVEEAQRRLKAGERKLAIHPYCGTNFALSGLAAGTAAWLAMLGGDSSRSKLDRLPLVVVLVTLISILTAPYGPKVQQKITTDADLGDLRVVQIRRFERGGFIVHRVSTREIPQD